MRRSSKSFCRITPALVLVLAAGLFLITFAAAARGQVQEGLHLKSALLGREVRYAVYLPSDYAVSTRRYPAVYLLHGYTDDESAWVQFGEIGPAADRAIADRVIPAMIIVMPDGGVAWYANDYQNKVRWEDMFVQEFIPRIDAAFRTRPDRTWSYWRSGIVDGLAFIGQSFHR